MDESSRAAQLATLREFCSRNTRAVLFDEPGGMLMDTFSARTLPLNLPELQQVEQRVNEQTRSPYLLLLYGDGRRLALTDAGIAFAPDLRNTGPLPELPQAVCLRDFQTLLAQLKHELYGHPDQPPTRATVTLLMMCIAILDGARAAGFEIGREERELEHHLAELEKRAPGGGSP